MRNSGQKWGFFLEVHEDFYSRFTSKFIDDRNLAYSNSSVGERGDRVGGILKSLVDVHNSVVHSM